MEHSTNSIVDVKFKYTLTQLPPPVIQRLFGVLLAFVLSSLTINQALLPEQSSNFKNNDVPDIAHDVLLSFHFVPLLHSPQLCSSLSSAPLPNFDAMLNALGINPISTKEAQKDDQILQQLQTYQHELLQQEEELQSRLVRLYNKVTNHNLSEELSVC